MIKVCKVLSHISLSIVVRGSVSASSQFIDYGEARRPHTTMGGRKLVTKTLHTHDKDRGIQLSPS